jgi:hypothetical protein
MLSLRHKFVFIHVPKTGGNSISRALAPFSEDSLLAKEPFQDGSDRFDVRNSISDRLWKHSPLTSYEIELGDILDSTAVRFSVTRNPYERMISHYFSPHRGRIEFQKDSFLEFVLASKPLEYFLRSSRSSKYYSKPVELLSFQSLTVDFACLMQKLELPQVELGHFNLGSACKSWREYYNQESLRAVRRVHGHEIDKMGYRFD